MSNREVWACNHDFRYWGREDQQLPPDGEDWRIWLVLGDTDEEAAAIGEPAYEAFSWNLGTPRRIEAEDKAHAGRRICRIFQKLA